MLKYTLKSFLSSTGMYRNYFLPPCTRTIRIIHIIFNIKQAIDELKSCINFEAFENYLRELEHA